MIEAQPEFMPIDLIQWVLSTLTAAALAVGGFIMTRLFKAIDRMESRLDDHQGRISRIEGAHATHHPADHL